MRGISERFTSALGLAGLLIAGGASVMTYELLMATRERTLTGVVQSCAQTQEPGFSAPSMPAEAGRYGYRCLVDLGTGNAGALPVPVTYDASDLITRQLSRGQAVSVIGARVGPWARFRPAGYARNQGSLQFGVLLLGCGLAVRQWLRAV